MDTTGGISVAKRRLPDGRDSVKRSPSRIPRLGVGKGGPKKYRKEFAAEAKALCFVGATNESLAEYFEVNVSTLSKWRLKYPEFREAFKAKEEADKNVVGSLYRRAMGLEVVEVHEREKDGDREVERVVRKQIPPDTTAMIFWLKNRNPEQWSDRQDLNLTDGRSIAAALNAGRDRVARLRQEDSDG